MSSVSGFLAAWRGLALAMALAAAMTAVVAFPGVAPASAASHRLVRQGVRAVPGSGMTLAQAPAGLRSAVRRTLRHVSAVSAGSAFQKARLTAADGATGDSFGLSVALSGSTAVVGAYAKNSGTGAAYVFTGSGGNWSQQAELTAADGAPGDNFGWSVALSGSTAVIGAVGSNSGTGAAYVFTGSGANWSQQAELTAADGVPGDNLGLSVAVSGSTAVVGARGKNSGTGAAYVFTGSGGTWSQRAELTAADGAASDNFGWSVAIAKSTVVVGAPRSNTQTGAAYVFTGSGATWSQRAELTAADGASGDQFGISVAVSGSTAVVGAYGENLGTGAAYVFTGSGATWSQRAELTAADGASADQFGISVAVSGSTVMAGAFFRNSGTGAAYVFTGSGGTWSQRAELTAADGAASDNFGYSVALSGSTAMAGAFGKNSNTGAAYVFVLPSQQAELTASGGVTDDNIGASVALSGSTAVVGAFGKNSNRGAAYVFTRVGSTWTQQATLTAAQRAVGDFFGFSVALSGTTAIVGAPGRNSQTGAAYVFVGSGSTWSRQATLTASGGASGDSFGVSVALSGTTAVAGASGKNSNRGAAYVFTRSGSTWTRQATLTAADGAAGDLFGTSVALSGTTAVAGASGNNSTGAAYVFTRSGSTWTQQAKLTASDGAVNDLFGVSVALSGTTAVVGAYGKNSQVGAAYVFTRSGTAWSQQAELTAANGAASDLFGNSVALSGTTAVVGASGGNADAGAAYVFTRSGTAWSQQAELTAANGAAGDLFGNSVALSGTTAVAGAPGVDSFTGAAYVFTNI